MSSNIDILLKLFETLKESSDKNEEATQQLMVQQLELVGHIKYLPIEDLKQALKDHAKNSAEGIDLCTETVKITSEDLMAEVKRLASKVNKMILVVLVTFTVLTTTYVFISDVVDHKVDHKQESIEWQKKIEKAKEDMINKAIKEFEKENH